MHIPEGNASMAPSEMVSDSSRRAKPSLKGPDLPSRARVLLIDPSEKGALPLYTSLIAAALTSIGMRPVVLGSRRLLPSEIDSSWPVRRWLPAERWPRPPDEPSLSKWRQGLAWLSCSTVIVVSVLLMRPKIIHFQHSIHIRLDPLLLVILRLFAPVVWTAHDTVPHDPSTNTVDRAKRIYALADLVLVHSSPAAEDVVRLSGVQPMIVNHPVRPVDVPPDRATARRQLGLKPHGRVAAAIGFIRAYKGYGLLADVWDRLGESAPTLLVVGQLVDQSERDVIRRLQAHPRADVRLGYASDRDVIAAFAAADIILLPHERGSDSGSLHLARAVGTPVISSD